MLSWSAWLQATSCTSKVPMLQQFVATQIAKANLLNREVDLAHFWYTEQYDCELWLQYLGD